MTRLKKGIGRGYWDEREHDSWLTGDGRWARWKLRCQRKELTHYRYSVP